MVSVIPSPEQLDLEVVNLYMAKDPLVGNLPVLIFHGASTTTNSTQNSSRIQAHIFSLGGWASFPRLTVSPTSRLYAAVHHLPEDQQGNEVTRGMAVSLLKYFLEMPESVKQCLTDVVTMGRSEDKPLDIFNEKHAAELATSMHPMDNTADVAEYVFTALAEKVLSWTDLDLILPSGTIQKLETSQPDESKDKNEGFGEDSQSTDYGAFQQLVEIFGNPSFLPTSKLKRAPSRPTAASRGRTLDNVHIESLHREQEEILLTEKNYVLKLDELATVIAPEFWQSVNLTSEVEKAMQRLFPPSLQTILELNLGFLNALRDLMDDYEEEDHENVKSENPWMTERDPTGTDSFARIMLRHIPKFKEAYQQYMRASLQFPTTISALSRDANSNFSTVLQQIGEQRLRSWLIEPVQRLPRYSLYIDNMVKELPAAHSSVNRLLKVRDAISDICALDDEDSTANGLTVKRLKSLVAKWPEALTPTGRLITAIDVTEMRVPFRPTSKPRDGIQHAVLLLFPDFVVVLKKPLPDSLSARGLVAEVDRPHTAPSTISILSNDSTHDERLTFSHSFLLQEIRFTEFHDGTMISLTSVTRSASTRGNSPSAKDHTATTRVYSLHGSYEGKTSKFNEEVARARVEYRFPEQMRDSYKWGLRVMVPQPGSLGIICAIFEDDTSQAGGLCRRHKGRIQVFATGPEDASEVSNPDKTSEIAAYVSILGDGQYRLMFRGHQGHFSTDNVHADDLDTVFLKRLSNIQRVYHQPVTFESALTQIAFTQKLLEKISIPPPRSNSRGRGWSQLSPVKVLSGFLSGSSRGTSSHRERRPINSMFIDEPPRTSPPADSNGTFLSRTNSTTHNIDESDKSKVTVVHEPQAPITGSLSQLETTFNTYIVALHARCGNVLSKNLRNRHAADELKVNELYNTLVEDPSQMQAAAIASVDVLFSAFEKFLNMEWKERIGPVIPAKVLRQMQAVFDTNSTEKVPERFKTCMDWLSPQNKRAFTAMTKLLFDLLDGCSNDGDRGALVMTFAEVLVTEESPMTFIPLLDRLVEDIDFLFTDDTPLAVTTAGLPSGSIHSSMDRGRSVNTGSVNSNGSSFRKRFGLGILTRENSTRDDGKSESESKVGSVLRSLSKRSPKDPDSQPSSISKSFLSRAYSTDSDIRKVASRSGPQERPGSAGSGLFGSRPGSAHNQIPNLLSINETPAKPYVPPSTPKRPKRRSSLSDLQNLHTPSAIAQLGSPLPKSRHTPESSVTPFQAARQALRPASQLQTPQRLPEHHSRLPSPSRKENMAPQTPSSNVLGTPLTTHPSKVPSLQTLRMGLKERPKSTMGTNIPSLSPKKEGAASPTKLKLQSPRKLRERIDKEKEAIGATGPVLREEISKIGKQMDGMNLAHASENEMTTFRALSARVKTLELRLISDIEDLNSQMASTKSVIETHVVPAEKKFKRAEVMYKEANAENELLYERFNSELDTILSRVRKTEETEGLMKQLKESQEEAARLRKENAKLKWENGLMRTQLN